MGVEDKAEEMGQDSIVAGFDLICPQSILNDTRMIINK